MLNNLSEIGFRRMQDCERSVAIAVDRKMLLKDILNELQYIALPARVWTKAHADEQVWVQCKAKRRQLQQVTDGLFANDVARKVFCSGGIS